MTDDPTRIRSIAVHRDDVVTALEATLRTDRHVVLRITPPFSGRMRARIHETTQRAASADARDGGHPDDPGDRSSAPIHIDPGDLVEGIPSYPEVDDTTAEHPEADIGTRRARHADDVDEWRRTARQSLSASVTIETGGGERRIGVVALG